MHLNFKLVRTIIIGISIIVIIIGIFARFFRLSIGSYWFDEIATLDFAQRPIIPLMTGAYFEPGKSPLHYIFFAFWVFFFGSSEGTTRILSAIVGSVSVVLFYIYTSRRFKILTALVGTALFSISWLHIWGSREVRYYAFLLLFSLIATIVFNLGLSNKRQIIIYIASCILGLYTHIIFVILLISHFLTSLIIRRFHKFNLYVFILPLIAYIPYIYQLYYYLNRQNNTSTINSNTMGQLMTQLGRAPMNIHELLMAFAGENSFGMEWLFGALVLILSVFLFRNKKVFIRYCVTIVSTFALIVLSTVWPINTLVPSLYYLYYLTPSVFILLCILIDNAARWYYVALITAAICIFCYFNIKYIASFDDNFNTWRYQDLSVFVQSLPDGSNIYFSSCGDLYMTQYYDHKQLYDNITCENTGVINGSNLFSFWYVAPMWDPFWRNFANRFNNRMLKLDTNQQFGLIIVRKYKQR